VIGGGIINGITMAGAWPAERVEKLLKDDPDALARWKRSIELAANMADDKAVPNGTRYDALRMLGVDKWDRRGKQIVSYLAKGTNDELQMGAVSALGDVPAAEATAALLDCFANLSPHNRNLAFDALLRNDDRLTALLDRLESKQLPATALPAARVKLLKSHANPAVRERAAKVLPKR
jgi:hypothetical protein